MDEEPQQQEPQQQEQRQKDEGEKLNAIILNFKTGDAHLEKVDADKTSFTYGEDKQTYDITETGKFLFKKRVALIRRLFGDKDGFQLYSFYKQGEKAPLVHTPPSSADGSLTASDLWTMWHEETTPQGIEGILTHEGKEGGKGKLRMIIIISLIGAAVMFGVLFLPKLLSGVGLFGG